MSRKRLTQDEIKNLVNLQEGGMSFMEIAIKEKISLWTVKYHLDKTYRETVKSSNLNRNRVIAEKKKNERS